jgi:D-lactate dehydrogenase
MMPGQCAHKGSGKMSNFVPQDKASPLIESLHKILPSSRIRTRLIDLVSFASDAGFYYLRPIAVVLPMDEQEIIALFRFSHQHRIPLVFRAGGTSLSGQSVTDGILVDLSQYWSRIRVEADGNLVRVQPGITGAMVNAHLKKFHRKIGPDPSSISAAMMGGILSNNASGMCCGVVQNSYHTTRYIRFILPDGQTFSTEQLSDYNRFATDCPGLHESLLRIRQRILSDEPLWKKIREKYLTKTTIGYSLNAFVDYEHPLDILAHLLIGAEGTLAFIAEAVMETVPDYPCKSTGLLYFPTIYDACQAIIPLTECGALMVELMDRASLRAVEKLPGMPSIVQTLPDGAAALLVEFQEQNTNDLRQRVSAFEARLHELTMVEAPVFTEDPKQQDFYWKVRKGLFPAVGAVRQRGTTVILEDLAFPVARLGDAILDIQALFRDFSYKNAIIFGHAKDGNIHFVITQSFNSPSEVDRYDRFLRAVVELVVNKYRGTLKAEHGTGRNMAPFVETEWGGEAYAIIREIKRAIDPEGLLNPGVIVNEDAEAHIRDLKELPTVEEEVDRCIECGYCEHRCPSRDLTLTPRRRIVLRRVLKGLELSGRRDEHAALLEDYSYHMLDTCAVDGLCATACPVDINTGDLVKRLRREQHDPAANSRALWVAKHFRWMGRGARIALKSGALVNSLFGRNALTRLTGGVRKWISAMPQWAAQTPAPPSLEAIRKHRSRKTPDIIYFPSCITRVMGSYEGREKNLMETFLNVCRKAGIELDVLGNWEGSCCSQIFGSKGYLDAQRHTASRILDQLWLSTQEGKIPVVIDVSSCAYTLKNLRPVLDEGRRARFDQLTILDSVEFLHDMVLPKVRISPVEKRIMLHPVCSLEKMHISDKFLRIAQACATDVTIPINAGCCGMAGDRGFLFPELTASATRAEAQEVCSRNYDGYYSSTKTCEMALSESVGRNYASILYLLDESLP